MHLVVIFRLSILSQIAGYCRATKKNIVIFLTDDQDEYLFGMSPMDFTKQLIAKEGATFRNAFVTTPICCVSRASILTGLYAHNHGTKNNSISGGCSSRHFQSRFESNTTFAKVLNKFGYLTFYAGKYLNKYGSHSVGGHKHIPEGWDWWNGLIGNSVYYDYSLSVNGTLEYHGNKSKDYLTTVIQEKALNFLAHAQKIKRDIPILLMLAPPAPHSPFEPEEKFKQLFNSTKAPRFPNFGDFGNDKHWFVKRLPRPLSPEIIHTINEAYRNRWRTLKSVDTMVKKIIGKMKEIGRHQDTYYIYSSDNGFHTGQFGMPLDKRQPYESDIRVPLLISGPNISNDVIVDEMALNIDLAPTILEMAEIPEDYVKTLKMDGSSLLPLLSEKFQSRTDRKLKGWRTQSLIEYWGERGGSKECPNTSKEMHSCDVHCQCYCYDSYNNTYACLRTLKIKRNANSIGSQRLIQNEIYCRFEDEYFTEEFYNLNKDKYQLRNKPGIIRWNQRMRNKIQRNLKLMKECEGKECFK